MESYQRKKLVAFFCFKNRDLLKSYCNKRIRKVIINDNGWQRPSIHYEKKKESPMNQQEIFTYIQKQYPTHPDTITKSGYPVTIFKNPRTATPYAVFYQPAERTTFMEVQAEPDMIGNYIEMYHLATAKHMDQKHWLAVPLDGSVSDSKVLDLLDMSYDLVDGQAEADGETEADKQE